MQFVALNFTEICESGTLGTLAVEYSALLATGLSNVLHSRLQVLKSISGISKVWSTFTGHCYTCPHCKIQ